MALLTNINGKLTVDSTGSVSFNRIGTSTTTGFTFPALDGGANQILKTNGSGVLSWVDDEDNDVVTKIIGGTNITVSPATGIGDVTVNADLAGTVTGSGAAGRVAYWTSASNISSDGAFRFDGTNVAIGGAIVASRKLAIYNTNADNELEFIGADYTNIYSNTDSTMAVEVIGDGALRLATKGGNLTIVTGGSSTFSGNVGIGITPSASFSGLEVLQLGKGMTIFGNTNDDRATMAANLIVNTSTAFEYVMDGLAGRFSIEDGNMVWGTAPTGLAGGVATVTTRMTLLNTGNVGIGVTGPTQPLEILAAGGYDKSSSGGQTTNGILIKGGATAGDQNTTGGIGFSFGTGTAGISGYQNGSDQDRVGLSFYTHGSGTGSGASQETMRIKSGGEVGIGTTNPGAKLEVNGDVLLTYLKATGNSVIGGTSINSSRLSVQDSKNGTANSPHFQILGNGYSAYHYLDTTAYNIVTNSTTREIRVIAQNGGVKLAYAATAWAANSDIALKENIKPLENVLDKIKDYRCVEYNLKESPEDKKIGFIAQDWVDDFPAIVNKDEKDMLGIKYTETIPVLLKAIQELTARIKELENK